MTNTREPTEFQKQLGDEDIGEFHIKDTFLLRTLEIARKFLELKPTNSVRLLTTLHLRGKLAAQWHRGSPALVRMRISRLASREGAAKVEWRLATAAQDETVTGVDLNNVESCFVGDKYGPSPMRFLGTQFGRGVESWRWHFPDVATIDVVMQLREPLGVLIVMEGSSENGIHHRDRGVTEIEQCFRRVLDHPSLREI